MHHLRQHLQHRQRSGFFAAFLVFALVLQGLLTGFSHGAMAAMPQGASLCLSSHDIDTQDPQSHACPCGIVCQSHVFTPAVPLHGLHLQAPTRRLQLAVLPVALSAIRQTPRDLGVICDVRGPPSLLMNG